MACACALALQVLQLALESRVSGRIGNVLNNTQLSEGENLITRIVNVILVFI